MPTDDFVSQLKQDIHNYCMRKYGDVFCDWKEIVPEGDNAAHVHFTVFDQHGYIVDHYGKAYYDGTLLRLKTMKA